MPLCLVSLVECYYAECHCVACWYAGCRCTECRGAPFMASQIGEATIVRKIFNPNYRSELPSNYDCSYCNVIIDLAKAGITSSILNLSSLTLAKSLSSSLAPI